MSNNRFDGNDTEDLEALFDSIVQANSPAPSSADPAPTAAPAAAPAVTPEAAPAVVAAVTTAPEAPAGAAPSAPALAEPASTMFAQIGQMTRKLHDTLRELGYDKALEKAASQIPDARDRLAYIATLTEGAAERALNAIDKAKPLQEKMESQANELNARWDRLFANDLSVEEFKELAKNTRNFLKEVPSNTRMTNAELLEIMMAQDFQDLTGQVIKKVVSMVHDMEQQLISFLVEYSPTSMDRDHGDGLLNGPVVNSDGRTDVVTNQEQVDDLLESLGF